jgi:hypothetical protein
MPRKQKVTKDRHVSRNGHSKKGVQKNGSGSFNWGKEGEIYEAIELDRNDPNYDSSED